MNIFQKVILIFFGLSFVLGFLIFSGILPIFQKTKVAEGVGGTVVIWGTIPNQFLTESIDALNIKNDEVYQIRYVQKREETFDGELVEALASGVGPDLIFLPHEFVVRHEDKLFPIPYESIPLRQYVDTYIDEARLFLRQDGLLSIPFSIDPMVMYWNRDLFTSAGLSRPPSFWEELFSLVPKFSVVDNAFNVYQSTLPFGEYRNIKHAKEILSLLILQLENPIITRGEDGIFRAGLKDTTGFVTPPAESSLQFYTEFSNPTKRAYSWNRSLPEAQDVFAGGASALYLGFASEIEEIRSKSPHLNFDVTEVPQPQGARKKTTYGRMTGVSILKTTTNLPTAFTAMLELVGDDSLAFFIQSSGLPPVKRDLIQQKPNDTFLSVFYDSALISEGWLDPDPVVTEQIFRTIIENVISGRDTVNSAVTWADEAIISLFK